MSISLQGGVAQVSASSVAVAVQTFANVVVNAGTDTIMVVFVLAEGDALGLTTTTSITFNGDALTQLATVKPANWSRADVWYIKAPDVTTADVVVGYGVGNTKSVIVVYVLDGVDQTTTFRTSQTIAATSGTSATRTVPDVISSDLVIDGVCIDGISHSPVPGADQTERADSTTTTGNDGASSTQPGSAGGVMSYSWTTSAPNSYIAIGVIATAAAGGGPLIDGGPILKGALIRGGRIAA